jgi:hypothetical protein
MLISNATRTRTLTRGTATRGCMSRSWARSEGKDVLLEYRWGNPHRFPEFARELVGAKVDVIATFGTPADINGIILS